MCFFPSEEMNLVPVLDAKVKILSIIFFHSHPGNTRERERERGLKQTLMKIFIFPFLLSCLLDGSIQD